MMRCTRIMVLALLGGMVAQGCGAMTSDVDLFLGACLTGDLTAIESFLDTGRVAIEAEDSFGKTGLMVAIKNGKTEVVKFLLTHGADTMHADGGGRTPLFLAADLDNTEIVQILLNTKKIDVNARTKNKETPLFLAAFHGNLAIVKALLGAGANPALSDRVRRTPLHMAAVAGRVDIVRTLLDAKGTIVDAQASDGSTALDMANERLRGTIKPSVNDPVLIKNLQRVVNLLSAKSSQPPLEAYQSEIGEEFASRNPEKVAYMAADATAEAAKSSEQKQLDQLINAAEHGDLSMVEDLIKRVDVNGYGVNSSRKFLKFKFEPEYKLPIRYRMETALYNAARAGKLDVVDFLLANGANANAGVQVEYTEWDYPLMAAAKAGHKAVVERLLEVPDLQITMGDGRSGGETAADKARKNPEIFTLIQRAAAKQEKAAEEKKAVVVAASEEQKPVESVSSAPAESQGWACSVCTYVNNPARTMCEMCQANRK